MPRTHAASPTLSARGFSHACLRLTEKQAANPKAKTRETQSSFFRLFFFFIIVYPCLLSLPHPSSCGSAASLHRPPHLPPRPPCPAFSCPLTCCSCVNVLSPRCVGLPLIVSLCCVVTTETLDRFQQLKLTHTHTNTRADAHTHTQSWLREFFRLGGLPWV